MKTFLKFAFLIFLIAQFALVQTEQSTETPKARASAQSQIQEQASVDEELNTRTFLVETTLTQKELENLLNNQTNDTKSYVYQNEINDDLNQTNQVQELNDDPFQKEIQKEIKQDSLHPLDEFHVTEVTEVQEQQLSNTTTLITKTKRGIFDSLYEKKYGKKYGFIVLVLVFIGVFVFHNLSAKEIGNQYNKDCFYYGNKEYMLKNY